MTLTFAQVLRKDLFRPISQVCSWLLSPNPSSSRSSAFSSWKNEGQDCFIIWIELKYHDRFCGSQIVLLSRRDHIIGRYTMQHDNNRTQRLL